MTPHKEALTIQPAEAFAAPGAEGDTDTCLCQHRSTLTSGASRAILHGDKGLTWHLTEELLVWHKDKSASPIQHQTTAESGYREKKWN